MSHEVAQAGKGVAHVAENAWNGKGWWRYGGLHSWKVFGSYAGLWKDTHDDAAPGGPILNAFTPDSVASTTYHGAQMGAGLIKDAGNLLTWMLHNKWILILGGVLIVILFGLGYVKFLFR
jgi:hypothetical protein